MIHRLSRVVFSLAAIAALAAAVPGCGSRHAQNIEVPKEKIEQWDKEEQEAAKRKTQEAASQGQRLD